MASIAPGLVHALAPPDFRCVICGPEPGRLRWRIDGWSIVRCRQCGLARTWPPPAASTLLALYDDPTYHDQRSDPKHAAWAQRARHIIATLPDRPASVLDFGAGEGHLVRAFREMDLDAAGVEPSPLGRKRALEQHGVRLLEALEEAPIAHFGAVTLLHALEHVPDPLRTLTVLGDIAAPGATMFIEVPHVGSADVLSARSRRAILDVPAHLHHFTPRSLRPLLARAGWSVVEVRLFNCGLVEAALSYRASRRRGIGHPPAPEVVSDRSSETERPTKGGPGCSASALSALRSALPGNKFQVVARRGD